jgi:flagellin-specific chaperone FliS
MLNSGYSKYQKNISLSATRLSQQIVMAFEKIISLMHVIEKNIIEERFDDKCNALDNASKIIYGLHSLMDLYIEKENQPLIEKFYRKAIINFNYIKYAENQKSLARLEMMKKEIKKTCEIWRDIDAHLANSLN